VNGQKIKVAFCQYYLAPWRIKFFEKLSQVDDLDIDFFMGSLKPKDSSWIIDSKRIKSKCRILFALKYKDIPLFNPFLLFRLIHGKYDVFISGSFEFPGTYIAFICSRLLRKPFILWSGETAESLKCGTNLSLYCLVRKYILRPIINWLLKKTEAFIVYGFKHKEHLINLGASPQKISIALNAPDIDFLVIPDEKITAFRQKYQFLVNEKLNRHYKVILYVGKLVGAKRVDVLIKAFQLLIKERSDVVLCIVGDGVQREELLKIAGTNPNIYFLGSIPRESLSFFYGLCDVFVLPGFGGVTLVEALYSGKPVVATNLCDNASILIKDGENGYLVRPGSIDELYTAMKNILEDEEKCKNMGISSKKIVQQFCSIESMVETFKNSIVKVLSARAGT
jgi:glycosyltransferase involved in cell wall biosynthesis